MKLKPIGIYRDADTKMPHMRAADYSTDAYDAVELRTDRKENPVIIMHSKRTAPLTWKVVYGFSEIFFPFLCRGCGVLQHPRLRDGKRAGGMMEYIRYYPLIRIDTEGTDYTAMTPTDSEHTVRENHSLWLAEVVPNYFRLGARDKPSVSAVNSLRVHCPKCGAALKTITVVTEERTLPLYACDNCTVRH